jgi:hypothetical protein
VLLCAGVAMVIGAAMMPVSVAAEAEAAHEAAVRHPAADDRGRRRGERLRDDREAAG